MNYTELLFNLPINIRNKYRKLERTTIKVLKNKWSIIFNNTCLKYTKEVIRYLYIAYEIDIFL